MNAVDEQIDEESWKRSLRISCRRFVRDVVLYQPSTSNDLLETLSEQLVDIAAVHAGFAHEMYGDREIVNRAIEYLGHV